MVKSLEIFAYTNLAYYFSNITLVTYLLPSTSCYGYAIRFVVILKPPYNVYRSSSSIAGLE